MALDLTIKLQSGIPIYQQIAHQILELIQEGVLEPGTQLPTIRKLALQLGVNFNTVARAYRVLDQGSVISTQHGRGTYILDPQPEEGAARITAETIEDLTRFYIRKASYLGFNPEEIRECFDKIAEEEEQT